jgi:hypothetical protein
MGKRLAIAALTAAVLSLTGVSAVTAGNPQVNHYPISDAFTDPDYCGTGKPVDISISGHGTEWLDPNQAVIARNNTEGDMVLTNRQNGATVIGHFAISFAAAVSGDPAGTNYLDFTWRGVPFAYRKEHGGMLGRHAGYITFRVTFNGDQFISFETLINRGPHTDDECAVTVGALGL